MMKLRLIHTIFILSVLGILSCTKKELTPKELVNWAEQSENGLIKEKTYSGINFRVHYKPLNYIIAKENNTRLNSKSYQRSVENLDGLEYINLTIYPSDGKQVDLLNYNISSIQEHQERIYYYSFRFQEDIYMERNGEKIPCELFHFVRDHGLSPELNFALGFEKKELKGDIKIVINDYVFDNGELNFIIKENDIKAMPALKI